MRSGRPVHVVVSGVAQIGRAHSGKGQKNLERDRQRVLIWRITLLILRSAHGAHFPGTRLGQCYRELMVLMAVSTLTTEGYPTTASKLSHYLEIPRETTRRILSKLIHKNLIRKQSRGYVYVPPDNPDKRLARVARAVKEIARNLD